MRHGLTLVVLTLLATSISGCKPAEWSLSNGQVVRGSGAAEPLIISAAALAELEARMNAATWGNGERRRMTMFTIPQRIEAQADERGTVTLFPDGEVVMLINANGFSQRSRDPALNEWVVTLLSGQPTADPSSATAEDEPTTQANSGE